MLILTIVTAWLFADFISGVAHWAEDRLLLKPSRFSFLEGVRVDNELHHRRPSAMLKLSLLANIETTAPLSVPASLVFLAIDAPTWITLGVFFSTFANVIHRFSHTSPKSLSLPVKLLQITGLFCSPAHHVGHHVDEDGSLVLKSGASRRYCVMTNYMNPVLDGLRFFRVLEFLVGAKGLASIALLGLLVGCGPSMKTAGISNFAYIERGHYRGGQPAKGESFDYLKTLGVERIVKLNLEDFDDEKAEAARVGIELVYAPIPLGAQFFGGDGLRDPVQIALGAMRAPGVSYVHCKNGWDRTGLVVGLYRVQSGWLRVDAYDEMKAFGFHYGLLGLSFYFINHSGD